MMANREKSFLIIFLIYLSQPTCSFKMTTKKQETVKSNFIQPEQLHQWLNDDKRPKKPVIFDVAFAPNTNGIDLYKKEHLPDALYLSPFECALKTEVFPMPIPKRRCFERVMSKRYSLNLNDTIVIYDHSENGLFTAARVWWIFKWMGHKDVRVLYGGLNGWKKNKEELKDYEIISSEKNGKLRTSKPGNWKVQNRKKNEKMWHIGMKKLMKKLKNEEAKWMFLDSRPKAGYDAAHPKKSINFPIENLLDENKLPKTKGEILDEFKNESLDIVNAKQIVTSCRTGIRASQLALLISYATEDEKKKRGRAVRLFNGSFTQFQAQADPSFIVKATTDEEGEGQEPQEEKVKEEVKNEEEIKEKIEEKSDE
ncbi:hypothetical protein SNEBB_001510 [Seison nebaliae]|nr:hypothetical protein SNEBB_001510 [Seison nebaliae]